MERNYNKPNSYKYLEQRLQGFINAVINKKTDAIRDEINTSHKQDISLKIYKRSNHVKWTDIAMVIITGLLAFYTYQLFKETTNSSEIIKDENRAFISVDSVKVNKFTPYQYLFTILIRNSGKTPAYNFRYCIYPMYQYNDDRQDKRAVFSYQSIMDTMAKEDIPIIIAAGMTNTLVTTGFLGGKGITIANEEYGETWLIAINILYDDVYQRHHFTHIFVRAKVSEYGTYTETCTNYNDAN